jgi:hypothetical protein
MAFGLNLFDKPINIRIMIIGVPKEIKNNENRVALNSSRSIENWLNMDMPYYVQTAGRARKWFYR